LHLGRGIKTFLGYKQKALLWLILANGLSIFQVPFRSRWK